MTCCVFVYAQTKVVGGKYTQTRSTSKMGNILTATGWDLLMNELDNDAIPDGAVMAFNLTECPEGWTPYERAVGKFILGLDNWNPWDIWGNKEVLLQSKNLPAHQHFIRMAPQGKFWENAHTRPVVVDWNTRKFPLAWKEMSNHNWEGDCYESVGEDWSMKCASDPADNHFTDNWKYGVKTSPDIAGVDDQKQVDIMNPYVKLLYCIKVVWYEQEPCNRYYPNGKSVPRDQYGSCQTLEMNRGDNTIYVYNSDGTFSTMAQIVGKTIDFFNAGGSGYKVGMGSCLNGKFVGYNGWWYQLGLDCSGTGTYSVTSLVKKSKYFE